MKIDSIQPVLQEIADRARAIVEADRCTIFQVDGQTGEIFSRVAHGLADGQEIRLPTSRGVIGYVCRSGRPLRMRDAYNDPRFDPSIDKTTGYRTHSILCVPVKDQKATVVGAMQLINKREGRRFSDEDERALDPLCQEIAAALSDA